MAKLDVTLINARDGEEWPAEVVVDKPVGWWVGDIVAQLGLPTEVGGQPVRYRFVVERTGRAVTEEETLEAAGLREGDVVRLERDPTPPPAAVVPAPKAGLPGWAWAAGGVLLLLVAALAVGGMLVSRQEAERMAATAQARRTATAQAQQTTARVREIDGAEMVFVPAGEFIMGSTDAEIDTALALCNKPRGGCKREWFEHESPQHTVYLDAFWIDKTEVTNAQYRRCVAAGKCKASEFANYAKYNGDAQPVVGASWHDAQAYCEWVGARLPTEAEWEKAARGTDGRTYPWGNEWDAGKANTTERGPGTTTAVGSYPEGVSLYGALDMAGNIWEWVADWYDGDYYAVSPERNPTGPDLGRLRVLRGGSCEDTLYNVRCASRSKGNPAHGGHIGFRCARS